MQIQPRSVPTFTLVLTALTAFAVTAFPIRALPSELSPVRAESINYSINATSLTQHCITQLHDTEAALDALLQRPVRGVTFANFVVPFENTQADSNDTLLADQLLGSVSSDRATRDASDACQSESDHMLSRVVSRPELSILLHAVAQSGSARAVADQKLLELWIAQSDRAGARLAPQQHKLYLALTRRLADLQSAYIANLSNTPLSVTLTYAQTQGLPSDFLHAVVHNPNGTVTVAVDESTVDPFMRNAHDESARRAFYAVYANRGFPENEPILREVLSVRLRLAALLGYRDWASYILADRMARSPQRVHRFLDGLDGALLPTARLQAARLARLKAVGAHAQTARLNNWDVAYYDEQLRRTEYAVDTNAVRRYFPVDHVIPSVFGIYARMLGIVFTPVLPAHAWASDVRQYAVSDAGSGRFIGTLYLDLYPRPGKYTHFASFPLLPQRRNSVGGFRPPIDAIIGNWPRPVPGEPATLSHDEVQTFFHEFGHAMAALLTTAPYETLSEGFRADFIEAPSQMLENFVWTPSILKELSANTADGSPLPDDLIAKLIAARHVDDALFNTQQILYADADLAFHSASLAVDPSVRWQQIAVQATPLVPPAFVHPEAAFAHIMGGYDAGYYGYLWSRVYAQDMFTAFEEAGVESPMVGARYRRTILEPARSMEPEEEVHAFLGRPVNPQAFYRDLGIRQADAAFP